MREILDEKLWIGNSADADDVNTLFDLGIAAVVDLAFEQKPKALTRDLIYCRFPLLDGEGNPIHILRTAIDTVANLIRGSIPTLVFCGAGMSRSPAIVAAAMAQDCQDHPNDCLVKITENHPHDVSPSLWSEIVEACQGTGKE